METEENKQTLSIWDHYYTFCGLKILIREDYEAGLGGTLFDGALCLCNYIEHLHTTKKASFQGKKIIELGAGCGLPGILLAKLGASVTITDIPLAMDLIAENIEANFLADSTTTPTAFPFDWTIEEDSPEKNQEWEYIICADTVYDPLVVPYFLKTLKRIMKSKTKVLFAHPAPRVIEGSRVFWNSVYNEFEVVKVDAREFVPDYEKQRQQKGVAPFQEPTKGVFILSKR